MSPEKGDSQTRINTKLNGVIANSQRTYKELKAIVNTCTILIKTGQRTFSGV